MAEFTLLKLNVEDADLTANAPYSRRKGAKGDEPTTEESSKKGAVIAALVGLCFCAAVAYIVRKKLFGREESESDDLNENIQEFTVET